MIIPDKWGQGQIFAFSALDGPSYYSDDFCGLLCADHIGIRFYSHVRRELFLANVVGKDLEFDAVTGDYICFHFPGQPFVRIIYAAEHLIIGNIYGDILPVAVTEGRHLAYTVDGADVHDTQDGDFSALKTEGGRFAYAFGHSRAAVLELADSGLRIDPDEAAAARLDFYARHGIADSHPYAQLYAKCLSVMKTQLYSPEADFKAIWSTPDRLPHRSLWLWDSVFHAVGHRHIAPSLAEDLIRAVLVHQSPDGFIPHMANPDRVSGIIQPPIIAWGIWQLYQTSRNKDFLREIYEHNRLFLGWCRSNRRQSSSELYTWQMTHDKNCRCDECGMDNSPRFDTGDALYAIDFSCFMANEARHMAKIADELGLSEDSAFFRQWFDRISSDINAVLWSEADGFYFDYSIHARRLNKVWGIASFLPLFAGVCTAARAASLVKHLQDPDSFATAFPVPSISKKDARFGSDMWRGPVWINYNYLLAQGLDNYSFCDLAAELREKTIRTVNYWYQLTGTISEFYDSCGVRAPCRLNRKGAAFEPYSIDVRLQSIRDYGWSCTLICDLLHQTAGQNTKQNRTDA